MLVQARATSYGLRDLRFVTRGGVRVLLDQAAGIVIDLLVALSVIALASAVVMLAASARAEVQRRLRAIGVRRALGAPRGYLAASQALEALLAALPAATLGVVAGTLAHTPTGRLLTLLNEPPPGATLLCPLLATWLVAIAIPVLAAAWPAWRAAGRPRWSCWPAQSCPRAVERTSAMGDPAPGSGGARSAAGRRPPAAAPRHATRSECLARSSS